MRRALVLAMLAGGCGDAVTLAISSDRPVPSAIDAICVGVADTNAHGGQFGRRYPVGSLPQTLRLEAGGADSALAWVRADRGGVPVARASAITSFADDVTLDLATCVRGASGAAAPVGAPVAAAVRVVASEGQGGTLVVAFAADGTATVVDAVGGALAAVGDPMAVGNAVTDVVALDIDGDCDDDLAIATAGGIHLWRRDGAAFTDAGTIGGTVAGTTALAAADLDGDGAIDLVAATATALVLYRNDGAGGFAADPAAIPANGAVAISALAAGDLDGDGVPDLIAGQAATHPLLGWLGAGGGALAPSAGLVAAVPLDVAHVTLVDVDGDLDLDLAVALANGPPRLYIDRAGHLEDQSFVRLPQTVTAASALAIGGFDDGCEPDLVAAAPAGTGVLHGQPGGALAAAGTAPGATDAILVDLDDDGDLDAILATPAGVVWLAR